MKILVAAASFHAHISGLQRHALNVVRCLLPQSAVSALHVVVAPWQSELINRAAFGSDPRLIVHIAHGMSQNSRSRNLWYYRQLPQLAAELDVNLVHLTYPMPVHAAAFHCPTVVTLHDLYPYEIPMNFGFPKFVFNQLTLKQCLRNVDAIACVSEITRFRLVQYMPAAIWRKAVRIYNCVEPGPLPSVESPIPGWHGAPFLLCIAQHRRNKNIPLVVRTFARLLRSNRIASDTDLVVVGIPGPETEDIYRLVASTGLGHRIHFLEGISEPELQWCYTRCEALLAPSATEGFGLPVAEALLVGCRVVCSDIPAHREIGDGQCHFVSLGSDVQETFAHAVVSAIKKPKNPSISFPEFSSLALAAQYVSLYRRLIVSAVREENVRLSPPVDVATSERQLL